MRKNIETIIGCTLILLGVFLFLYGVTKRKTIREERAESEETGSEPAADEGPGTPEPEQIHLNLLSAGEDLFQPSYSLGYDYRYGTSMMLEEDGSIHAWFSAQGDSSRELDWITYQKYENEKWTEEKVVLTPAPGSLDALSVCDPDVFYYDGFYYLGYTSTIEDAHNGMCNSIFLARSEKPDGPFEKWNGNKFGGDPVPWIYYDGPQIGWGCGEPSFVRVDDVLYIYSTRISFRTDLSQPKVTEVRTADLTDPDWPRKLEYRGDAVDRTDDPDGRNGYPYSDSDSLDVIYHEPSKLFLALCTNRRFTSESCLLYYTSSDGIHFGAPAELKENVICGCHNSGIMGDREAHIKAGDPVYIAYSFSGVNAGNWGRWATRLTEAAVTIEDETAGDREPGMHYSEGENLKERMIYRSWSGESAPTGVGASSLVNRIHTGQSAYLPRFYWYDSLHLTHGLDTSLVKISGYDESVIKIEEGRVSAVGAGTTLADIEYQGLRRQIRFSVTDGSTGILDLDLPLDEYRLSLSQAYISVLRPLARLSDYTLRELEESDLETYHIEFWSSDENVCMINDDGTFIPMMAGTAEIAVTGDHGLRADTMVSVVE